MCSELCKDFYVVYQLEMVAGEVENSCQLVVAFFFFFFFFLVSPYQTIEISLGQPSGAPPHINYFLRRCVYKLEINVFGCPFTAIPSHQNILLACHTMTSCCQVEDLVVQKVVKSQ